MYFVHVYIFLKKFKKKFQDSQIFPKKREKFSKKKKIFGPGALSPYVILKKKKKKNSLDYGHWTS